MIYLLASILSSTAIFVLFKLFKPFQIDRLQAIVFNYFSACLTGLFFYDTSLDYGAMGSKVWLPGALVLGILFIVVFNLMAITTNRSGMAAVSVATKMSVALPVLFGIFYFNESTGFLKICGILLALVSVYLTSSNNKKRIRIKFENLMFPVLVFLGSGSIDTIIKFLEYHYIPADEIALFSSSIFAFSFILGMIFLVIRCLRTKNEIQLRNILAGMILGLPNYFSIYFIVKALRTDWESATVFVVNNVGIVILASLVGLILFKERLLKKNWIGLLMAALSILLISYGTA